MRTVTYINRGIVSAATIGALLSLGAMFSAYHLVFDLISHFRVQYIVMLLPAFVLAMVTKRTYSVLIICVTLAIHGYVVTMSLLPRSSLGDSGDEYTELTVLNSNLLHSNKEYQEMLDLIQAVSPDIIAFQEYTHTWDTILTASLTSYPYRATYPGDDAFGIALFSKHPISGPGAISSTIGRIKPATAQITVDNKELTVFSVHPPPPVSSEIYALRNATMELIANDVKAVEGHVIVMGDFNATPWTAHYNHFTSKAALHNARAGFGFQPTWPSDMVLLQIPIDHILLSKNIRSTAFASRKLVGSDHRSIWSTVRIH